MYYSKLEKSWLDSRISHELVSLLTSEVSNIVTPSSSSTIKNEYSSTTTTTATTCIPPLHDFIDLLTQRSRTKTGTLLIAFILLNRLSYRLGYVTTGMASAPQRIFLASLIISTKLINDTSPKNKHWMTFANDYFELNEINLMEKQFLTLMDFNLSITEKDFQQAVNRYKQLQKYGRHHSNMNHQQYHHQCHLKNNNKNKNNNNSNTKRKSNQWQGTTITPDILVTPVRNVASSISNKNATLTRSSSSSMVISTSSSSTSIASSFISPPPPLYESSLSNSSSSSTLQSYSPSSPMNIISSSSSSLHNPKYDNHHNFKWCHQQQQQQQQQSTTRYISPLFST